MLPVKRPTEVYTVRLPPVPADARHRTPLSDSQTLASLPLTPTPAPTVCQDSPSPDPYTVTLPDPVLTTLCRQTALRLVRSADTDSVALPCCPPMVTAAR